MALPFALVAAAVVAAAPPAEQPLGAGVSWQRVEHRGAAYRVVRVDLHEATIELVGQRPLAGGRPAPHRPAELDAALQPGWVAATNAGLYHRLDEPVGLHVEQGVVSHPIELGDGVGNFFLRPNGVFTIDGAGARIVDSTAYAPVGPVTLATQSGPALVLGGALHPRLLPDSPSLAVRNAVGVAGPATVYLALSEAPVRFWDLATLLRDVLGCTDALYLDGNISGMWGPGSGIPLGTGLPAPPSPHAFAGFLVVRPGRAPTAPRRRRRPRPARPRRP